MTLPELGVTRLHWQPRGRRDYMYACPGGIAKAGVARPQGRVPQIALQPCQPRLAGPNGGNAIKHRPGVLIDRGPTQRNELTAAQVEPSCTYGLPVE